MSQFVILDHSLRKAGGHHLEYAVHTAQAAEELGYEVTLATHRKFSEAQRIRESWRLLSVFPYTTYQPYTIHESSRGAKLRRGWRKWISRASALASPLRKSFESLDRRRRIRAFADACERVFRASPLQSGDEVFVPTLSEFDLLGLVEYLQRDERTQLGNWHLQFHFNVFNGREPEYAEQSEREQLVIDRLCEPLEKLARHRTYLYTTCDLLARQFNRLGVGQFDALAYPIDPAIANNATPESRNTPLRVTVAGAIREEKGHQHLHEVFRDLHSELLGRAKLVIQSNKSWFRLDAPSEEAEAKIESRDVEDPSTPWVEYVPHPLGPEAYSDLIGNADVGLLLYDSRRYYARRAGILGEYLAAGKPVVVPAGCWLSEQLVEPQCQHVERLLGREESTPIAELTSMTTHGQASWSPVNPSPGDAIVLRFHWDSATEPGSYCRIVLKQNDWESKPLREQTEICGQRATGGPMSLLFELDPQARYVQATFDNAYGSAPLQLFDIRMQQLHSALGVCPPRSAVGVIFADESRVADCTREVLNHYEHYRTSAHAFAGDWMQQHHPVETVAQLLRRGRTQVLREAA